MRYILDRLHTTKVKAALVLTLILKEKVFGPHKEDCSGSSPEYHLPGWLALTHPVDCLLHTHHTLHYTIHHL